MKYFTSPTIQIRSIQHLEIVTTSIDINPDVTVDDQLAPKRQQLDWSDYAQ